MADELTILMRLRGGRQTNAELATTAGNIEKINRAAVKSTRGLGSMSRSLNRTGDLLTRRLALPAAIAGGASVKMALDYEASLTKIETLVGISEKQVKSWSGELLKLSHTTAVAPKELADALYFVTSSGIAVNKTMSVMRAVAKGAALGLGDTATIAQVVTSAMNAYADSNLTAEQTMDTLVAGTKAGKLEATDLSESLGRVLPIASRLSVPLNEVVASLEAMSLTGGDAEQDVTQLSAFFSGLVKVTPQAAKALKHVGLNAKDLRADLANPTKGLPFVIKELDKAFDGNIETMAKVFPNIRALRAQLALTGPQAKNVARVFRETRNSAGDMGKAFAKLSKSDAQKFKVAINDLRIAGIKLGIKLLPVVTKLADGVSVLAAAIAGHPTVGISLLAAMIVVGPMVKFIAFLYNVRRAMVLLRLATFATSIETAGFGATLTAALLGPIGLAILAIAALAIGLYLLDRRTHVLRDHWKGLIKILAFAFGGVFLLALTTAAQHIKGLIDLVKRLVHWVKKVHMPHVPGTGSGGIAGGLFGFAKKAVGRAGGGSVQSGERTLVGERGPEIVRLPMGARVHSNSDSFGSQPINVHVTSMLDGKVVAESTARVVADRKARR